MSKNMVIHRRRREGERGSAGVKFTIVLVILFLIGYALINYVPTAYEGASFKEEMHTAVVQGSALPTAGDPIGVTKLRLKRMASSNNLPPDTFLEVKAVNSVIQARVVYSKQVSLMPFGLYNYNYYFDHTATPTGFLTKQ